MFDNYEYFIVLAEELNISRAASRLFVTHQCLSKYLSNLEHSCGVPLFTRKPTMQLTFAGKSFLDTVKKIQNMEIDMNNLFTNIRGAKTGQISLGTTAGRYRILVPQLLSRFSTSYPGIVLDTQYVSNSKQLEKRVLNNQLDVAIINSTGMQSSQFDYIPLYKEQLYFIISKVMLRKLFPDSFPECVSRLKEGVDLREFASVPFILGKKSLNSRRILDEYCSRLGITLNCVMELSQLDLQIAVTMQDFAASFCWSMYLSSLARTNRFEEDNFLYAFPLKDWDTPNYVMLITRSNKIQPKYEQDLISLIIEECRKIEKSSHEVLKSPPM